MPPREQRVAIEAMYKHHTIHGQQIESRLYLEQPSSLVLGIAHSRVGVSGSTTTERPIAAG